MVIARSSASVKPCMDDAKTGCAKVEAVARRMEVTLVYKGFFFVFMIILKLDR